MIFEHLVTSDMARNSRRTLKDYAVTEQGQTARWRSVVAGLRSSFRKIKTEVGKATGRSTAVDDLHDLGFSSHAKSDSTCQYNTRWLTLNRASAFGLMKANIPLKGIPSAVGPKKIIKVCPGSASGLLSSVELAPLSPIFMEGTLNDDYQLKDSGEQIGYVHEGQVCRRKKGFQAQRHRCLSMLAAPAVGHRAGMPRIQDIIMEGLQEVALSAQLGDPGVWNILSLYASLDRVTLVSELNVGKPLQSVLDEYPEGVPVPVAVAIFKKVLHTLMSLHERQRYHLGVSPTNVLLNLLPTKPGERSSLDPNVSVQLRGYGWEGRVFAGAMSRGHHAQIPSELWPDASFSAPEVLRPSFWRSLAPSSQAEQGYEDEEDSPFQQSPPGERRARGRSGEHSGTSAKSSSPSMQDALAKADVFSAGATLWAMLSGSEPFTVEYLHHCAEHKLLPNVMERWVGVHLPERWMREWPYLLDLLTLMLQGDPKGRPSAPSCLMLLEGAMVPKTIDMSNVRKVRDTWHGNGTSKDLGSLSPSPTLLSDQPTQEAFLDHDHTHRLETRQKIRSKSLDPVMQAKLVKRAASQAKAMEGSSGWGAGRVHTLKQNFKTSKRTSSAGKLTLLLQEQDEDEEHDEDEDLLDILATRAVKSMSPALSGRLQEGALLLLPSCSPTEDSWEGEQEEEERVAVAAEQGKKKTRFSMEIERLPPSPNEYVPDMKPLASTSFSSAPKLANSSTINIGESLPMYQSNDKTASTKSEGPNNLLTLSKDDELRFTPTLPDSPDVGDDELDLTDHLSHHMDLDPHIASSDSPTEPKAVEGDKTLHNKQETHLITESLNYWIPRVEGTNGFLASQDTVAFNDGSSSTMRMSESSEMSIPTAIQIPRPSQLTLSSSPRCTTTECSTNFLAQQVSSNVDATATTSSVVNWLEQLSSEVDGEIGTVQNNQSASSRGSESKQQNSASEEWQLLDDLDKCLGAKSSISLLDSEESVRAEQPLLKLSCPEVTPHESKGPCSSKSPSSTPPNLSPTPPSAPQWVSPPAKPPALPPKSKGPRASKFANQVRDR